MEFEFDRSDERLHLPARHLSQPEYVNLKAIMHIFCHLMSVKAILVSIDD
jgi:hypothetical protein